MCYGISWMALSDINGASCYTAVNFLFIINCLIIILLIWRQMTMCILLLGNYLKYIHFQFLSLYHLTWQTRCWAHHLKVMTLNST